MGIESATFRLVAQPQPNGTAYPGNKLRGAFNLQSQTVQQTPVDLGNTTL